MIDLSGGSGKYKPLAQRSSYASLWNAFKRIVASASADEKLALFSGTARRVYRLADA